MVTLSNAGNHKGYFNAPLGSETFGNSGRRSVAVTGQNHN